MRIRSTQNANSGYCQAKPRQKRKESHRNKAFPYTAYSVVWLDHYIMPILKSKELCCEKRKYCFSKNAKLQRFFGKAPHNNGSLRAQHIRAIYNPCMLQLKALQAHSAKFIITPACSIRVSAMCDQLTAINEKALKRYRKCRCPMRWYALPLFRRVIQARNVIVAPQRMPQAVCFARYKCTFPLCDPSKIYSQFPNCCRNWAAGDACKIRAKQILAGYD